MAGLSTRPLVGRVFLFWPNATPSAPPSSRSRARATKIIWPATDRPTRFNPRIQRHTQRYRDLYRGRAAIEREFGTLKHYVGLAPLRVRGIERVALHADLVMLARLAQALSRAREAVPLAA